MISPLRRPSACASRPILARPVSAGQREQALADARASADGELRVAPIEEAPKVRWNDPMVHAIQPEETVQAPQQKAPTTVAPRPAPPKFDAVETCVLLGVALICGSVFVWMVVSVIRFNMR